MEHSQFDLEMFMLHMKRWSGHGGTALLSALGARIQMQASQNVNIQGLRAVSHQSITIQLTLVVDVLIPYATLYHAAEYYRIYYISLMFTACSEQPLPR